MTATPRRRVPVYDCSMTLGVPNRLSEKGVYSTYTHGLKYVDRENFEAMIVVPRQRKLDDSGRLNKRGFWLIVT